MPGNDADLAHFFTERRVRILREGFNILRTQLPDLHMSYYAEEMGKRGTHVSERTLERFKSGNSPLRNNQSKANLLIVCGNVINTRLQGNFPATTNLLNLYNEYKEQFNVPDDHEESISSSQREQGWYTQEELEKIQNAIIEVSQNDPDLPEFPPLSPKFPATPTYPLQIDENRTIYIKDESYNPTGSHKDRMAWELVLYYKNTLIPEALTTQPKNGLYKLKAMSMLSAGTAALAVQHFLRFYGLPNLHVLMDKKNTAPRDWLERLGCQITLCDLDQEELKQEDIKRLTNNSDGIDVTWRDETDPDRMRYYDWLSFEIINEKPKHVFVPVGTGDLFHNILKICEYSLHHPDRRRNLDVTEEDIRSLNIYGVTTSQKNSIMTKLYAAFRPHFKTIRDDLENMKQNNICGSRSNLYEIDDHLIGEAQQLVKGKITTEPSGIAGLAYFLQIKDEIPREEKVLIVNTGRLHIPTLVG